MFQALKDGLKSQPIMVPYPTDLSKYVTNTEKDWYVSLFQFNASHKALIEKSGTFKGIKDTTTDRLFFDLDSANNLPKAQEETANLVQRLIDDGFPLESIQVYFSGNKGFSVQIDLLERITPEQFKAIIKHFSKDFETLDVKITDPVRIVRLPGTRHQDSKLFKIELEADELLNLSAEDIKTLAKTRREMKIEYKKANLPQSYMKLSKSDSISQKSSYESKLTKKLTGVHNSEIDFHKKPKDWRNCKWALLQGEFGSGKRDWAMMVLAATCRGLGYDQNTALYMCKAALHSSWDKHGEGSFSEEELENNVINVVYDPLWKGGQYSCKSDLELGKYCEALGDHKCSDRDNNEKPCIDFSDMHNNFADYAKNFESNVIKTGIKSLDENVMFCSSILTGVLGAPGAGKCLGKGTRVLMYNGSLKNVEDILPGDLLMGDDSTPRTVLNITQGIDQLYKIHQKNGKDYVVNSCHILSLMGSSRTKKHYKYGTTVDIELQEYLQKNKDFKKRMKGYKTKVDFSFKQMEFDPYFIGYWLGDGTLSKAQVTVHKSHNKLINYLIEYGKTFCNNVNIKPNSENSITINFNNQQTGSKKPNILLNWIRKTFSDKYIPNNYLLNNKKNRLKLLAGLIDSDGYYDSRRNSYEITVKQHKFAEQICFLSRSLGFKTTINKTQKTIKKIGFIGEYYRILITNDDFTTIPCLVPYKIGKKIKKQRHYNLTEIRPEQIGVGEYYGFELDGNGRFLLEDFTVTHNTSFSLNYLLNTSKNGIPSIFLSLDMGMPLVFSKLIQKKKNLNFTQVLKLFKDFPEEANKIVQEIKDEYKNVGFNFKSGLSVKNIREIIIEHEKNIGKRVKLVVIDYLECLSEGLASDPTINSGMIANKLKDLANELNVCIVLLLQTQKHATPNVSDPLLSLKMIKGSSLLEQSMSVILTLWRDGYNAKTVQDDNYISFACVKNRLGSLWQGDFHWEGKSGTIRELTVEEDFQLTDFRDRKKREKLAEQKERENTGWD